MTTDSKPVLGIIHEHHISPIKIHHLSEGSEGSVHDLVQVQHRGHGIAQRHQSFLIIVFAFEEQAINEELHPFFEGVKDKDDRKKKEDRKKDRPSLTDPAKYLIQQNDHQGIRPREQTGQERVNKALLDHEANVQQVVLQYGETQKKDGNESEVS